MTEKLVPFSKELEELIKSEWHDIGVRYDEPMACHTTFKIGGPAGMLVAPFSVDSFKAVCELIKKHEVKYFVLGNGSNVLFDDSGYDGVVLSTSGLKSIKYDENENILHSSSGVKITFLAKKALDYSLTGLEFAYGIPGTVGGAVYMNAGAYGGEISSILLDSEYISLESLEIKKRDLSGHMFGYRDSIYRHENSVILSASFALAPGNRTEIKSQMEDLMHRRETKQPLEYPSAGSVFKRCEGRFTGQMIEEAGLKGFRIGGAEVSEKHAGFIINKGGASSSDVLSLIDHIKKVIKEKFGCELECEVIRVN